MKTQTLKCNKLEKIKVKENEMSIYVL